MTLFSESVQEWKPSKKKRMRKKCQNNRLLVFLDKNQVILLWASRKKYPPLWFDTWTQGRNGCMHWRNIIEDYIYYIITLTWSYDTVAEWLRRWIANPLLFERTSWNLALVMIWLNMTPLAVVMVHAVCVLLVLFCFDLLECHVPHETETAEDFLQFPWGNKKVGDFLKNKQVAL